MFESVVSFNYTIFDNLCVLMMNCEFEADSEIHALYQYPKILHYISQLEILTNGKISWILTIWHEVLLC